MDNQRDDKRREQEGPGLEGPDYFSLVIEWEGQDQAREAAPNEPNDDEITDRQSESWDIVDEASYESFPASDPPAWGSSHATATAESAAECEPVAQAIDPDRLAARLGRIAFAVAAVGAALHWIRQVRRHYVSLRAA